MQPEPHSLSTVPATTSAHPLRCNAGLLLAALVALGAASGADAYRSRSYGRSRRYGYRVQAVRKVAAKPKPATVNAARHAPGVDTGARPSIPPSERPSGGIAVIHESEVGGRIYAQPQAVGSDPAPASISEASAPSSVAVGVPGVGHSAAPKRNRPRTLAEQKAANHAARLAAKQAQAAARAAWLARAAPGQAVPKATAIPTAAVPASKVPALAAPRRRTWSEYSQRVRSFRSRQAVRRPLIASRKVTARPVAKPLVNSAPSASTMGTVPTVAAKPVAQKPVETPQVALKSSPAFTPAANPVGTSTVPVRNPAPVAPTPVAEASETVSHVPAAKLAQSTEAAPVAQPDAPEAADLESRPLSDLHPDEKNGSQPASGNVVLDVLLKLASVVGLIGASAFGWKKLQGVQGRKAAQSLETVQVNSTASLGPQRFLHVVTVGQQRFLVSSSPQQISLIAPIDEGTTSAAALASAGLVAQPAPAPAQPAAPATVTEDDARYNDLLRQIRAAGVSVDPTPAAPAPAPAPVPAETRPTFASLAEAMNAPSNDRAYSMFRTENDDEATRNA